MLRWWKELRKSSMWLTLRLRCRIYSTRVRYFILFFVRSMQHNMHGGQSEPTTIVTGYVCSRDPVNFTLNIILKRYEFKGNSSSPPPPCCRRRLGWGKRKEFFKIVAQRSWNMNMNLLSKINVSERWIKSRQLTNARRHRWNGWQNHPFHM